MKPQDLQTDTILTDRTGTHWRVSAVNHRDDKRPHFMADMIEPGQLNGATFVSATFPLAALHNFEPCVTAIS